MELKWDQRGEHVIENGVSNGVLYPIDPSTGNYEDGVAWNGLTAVNESPEGGEVTTLYADNIPYINLVSAEQLKATIEAYTYPDEFAECDGSASLVDGVTIGQQPRKSFGFCYATKVANDVTSEYGVKIHIIYNAIASPTEKAYETINDSPDGITFSWEISTTPIEVADHKPTSTVVIDSTKLTTAKFNAVKAALYGSQSAAPTLLSPAEIVALVNSTQG